MFRAVARALTVALCLAVATPALAGEPTPVPASLFAQADQPKPVDRVRVETTRVNDNASTGSQQPWTILWSTLMDWMTTQLPRLP